jgi:hypothetical protein
MPYTGKYGFRPERFIDSAVSLMAKNNKGQQVWRVLAPSLPAFVVPKLS